MIPDKPLKWRAYCRDCEWYTTWADSRLAKAESLLHCKVNLGHVAGVIRLFPKAREGS